MGILDLESFQDLFPQAPAILFDLLAFQDTFGFRNWGSECPHFRVRVLSESTRFAGGGDYQGALLR